MGAKVFSYNEGKRRFRGDAPQPRSEAQIAQDRYDEAAEFFADSVGMAPLPETMSEEERRAARERWEKLAKEAPINRERLAAATRASAIACYSQMPEGIEQVKALSAPPRLELIDAGGGTLFQDRADIRETLGPAWEEYHMAEAARAEVEAMPLYGEWSQRIMSQSGLVGTARIKGFEGDQILGPEDLRAAMATERVYLAMRQVIPQAREKASQILADLKRKSPDGVKSGPFVEALRELSRLGEAVTGRLDKMRRMADAITGSPSDPRAREACEELDRVLQEARAVFAPLTGEGYQITMAQVGRLQRFMAITGGYLDETNFIIESGHQRIRYNEAIGRHQVARGVEESLQLPQQKDAFNAHVDAMGRGLFAPYVVVAHQAFGSTALLNSVPPRVLAEAGRGNPVLERGRGRNQELVLPGHYDLESE